RLANKGEASRSVAEGGVERSGELYEIHHQLAAGAGDAWSFVPGAEGDAGHAAAAEAASAASRGSRETGAGEPDAADCEALAAGIAGAPTRDPVTGKADNRLANALAKAVESLRKGDWEGFVGQGVIQKVVTGENEYYRKPMPPEVVTAVRNA